MSRSATTLVSEDFSELSATGSTTDVGDSLDSYTAQSGWTGYKVYADGGKAKVGASKDTGWIATPSMDIPAGAVLSCVISQFGSDTSPVSVTVVDINDVTLATLDASVTPSDATLEWTFDTGYSAASVKFTCTSKKRFYLDDVTLAAASSGGDGIWTFNVPEGSGGTSYQFTDLTPETTYYSRVKGNAGWSGTVSFQTLGSSDTAPAIAPIADQTVAVEELAITVPLTVTGNPAPTVTVTSSDAPDDSFCIDSNGDFYFLFDEATGTFHFTITAANGVSPDATRSFTVTVTGGDTPLSDYQQWLQEYNIATNTSADAEAPNGHTYGENYAADINPASSDFLDLVVTDVSSGQFTILNYSTNRYYQLLYTTDLSLPLESYTATNLGKGATSGTFPVDGDWFGGLRVTPTPP